MTKADLLEMLDCFTDECEVFIGVPSEHGQAPFEIGGSSYCVVSDGGYVMLALGLPAYKQRPREPESL